MKLIIEIDEEDYKIMKHNIAVNNPLCPLSQEKMVAKVAHGIPLEEIRPEIDEEQEEDDYIEWVTYYNEAVNDALLAIDNLCYAKKMIGRLDISEG